VLYDFLDNFRHDLFRPLLLFFDSGFLVPSLGVKFDIPYVTYQAMIMYLLFAIGWHGGEELAQLSGTTFGQAIGFMVVGFVTNTVIGFTAYFVLRACTRLRRIDAATVAGSYGSVAAGTFVTCLGVLEAARISYAAYMPVMLAIMESPGCLVALFLVARLRHHGMDPLGTMPDEPGYDPAAKPLSPESVEAGHQKPHEKEVEWEEEMALEKMEHDGNLVKAMTKPERLFSLQLLHEVFLNPGIYLLFTGIAIGLISGLQGAEVTRIDDPFFVTLFHGVLCLFLFEMGITASRELRDLKTGGVPFVLFGLIAPNVFAMAGILVAHAYSHLIHRPLDLGTYALFSVLCGGASYIALPAVQRMAIREASPTLPLAAAIGLTFSYNVTVGIPFYIEVAKLVTRSIPV
jgi:hypothetical protein